MEAIITTITSSIGIGTLVFFLLKSFLGEKFKNMATLQDIGKITKEVESVKQTFTTQTEKLKQELSVLTNKHNILFNEEKEALIFYISAWNLWYSNLKIILSDYDITNYSELKSVRKKWNAEYDNVQLAFSKVEIFVNNEDIINLAIQLNNATYNLQKEHNNKYLVEIYNKYNILNHTQKEIKNGLIKGRDEKVRNSINKLNDEIALLKKENYQTSRPFYTTILNTRQQFIAISKKYIRKDIIA